MAKNPEANRPTEKGPEEGIPDGEIVLRDSELNRMQVSVATPVTITAIICLTIILVTCLYHGIDHFVVGAIITVIAGLAGYKIKLYKVWNQK